MTTAVQARVAEVRWLVTWEALLGEERDHTDAEIAAVGEFCDRLAAEVREAFPDAESVVVFHDAAQHAQAHSRVRGATLEDEWDAEMLVIEIEDDLAHSPWWSERLDQARED